MNWVVLNTRVEQCRGNAQDPFFNSGMERCVEHRGSKHRHRKWYRNKHSPDLLLTYNQQTLAKKDWCDKQRPSVKTISTKVDQSEQELKLYWNNLKPHIHKTFCKEFRRLGSSRVSLKSTASNVWNKGLALSSAVWTKARTLWVTSASNQWLYRIKERGQNWLGFKSKSNWFKSIPLNLFTRDWNNVHWGGDRNSYCSQLLEKNLITFINRYFLGKRKEPVWRASSRLPEMEMFLFVPAWSHWNVHVNSLIN